jgi:hypothetical protein
MAGVRMAKIDITFGRSELKVVRRAALGQNWAALSRALADGVVDGDDRSDRMAVAVKTVAGPYGPRVCKALDEWVRAEPDNPTALLLRGGVEVQRAWQIRGAALASQTKPQRLVEFQAVLGRAEVMCWRAAQLDPADPTPWHYLLQMARGQGVGLQETLARRDELIARSPHHFSGHYQAVQSLSPMWGCPYPVMYEQVRRWIADVPEGSPLHGLVFVAYVEGWRREMRRRDPLLRDPEMLTDAHRATESMTMEQCKRPADFWTHNYAAGWYSVIKDRERARAHFAVMRGYLTEWPWGDFSVFPILAYRKGRVAAWLKKS